MPRTAKVEIQHFMAPKHTHTAERFMTCSRKSCLFNVETEAEIVTEKEVNTYGGVATTAAVNFEAIGHRNAANYGNGK